MRNVFKDAFDGPGGGSSFEDVEVLRASPKALLVKFPDGREKWVPKSQMEAEGDVLEQGDRGTLVISSWLAQRWEEEGDQPPDQEEAPVRLAKVVCLRETDAALQVRVPGQREPLWMPKSQVQADSEVQHDGDVGELVISAWIAGQKKLGPQREMFGEQEEGSREQKGPPRERKAPSGEQKARRTAQDDMEDETVLDRPEDDDVPF